MSSDFEKHQDQMQGDSSPRSLRSLAQNDMSGESAAPRHSDATFRHPDAAPRHSERSEESRREAADGGARSPEGSRVVMALFLAACCIVCLLPLVGMLWAPTTTTTENRELASEPELTEDGQLNIDYLTDWGTYFEDHFAYRNYLVSANAKLRVGLLGTSPIDTVVAGTDGWLYYAGTLSDFCAWSNLSERGIDNIAFNLSLMQGYVEAQGAEFTVAIAPNKNSLYADNMPYYYVAGTTRNLDALEEALEARGVNHADLYATFEEQDERLYYLRDTHWNTKGALLAWECIEASLGHDTSLANSLEPNPVSDYVGDVNEMLYPVGAVSEDDFSYADELDWSYVEGEDVEDSWVATQGGGVATSGAGRSAATSGAGESAATSGTGGSDTTANSTLLMFRDSFTNNLLQFFATSYKTAYFTKYVPYDLTRATELGADTVIIERAERNLSDLGENPAIMPAPSASIDITPNDNCTSDGLEVSQDGIFTVVSGVLPEEAQAEDASIYIGVENADGVKWYLPFHVSADECDFGYKAYLSQSSLEGAQKIWVACESDGTANTVQAIEL